jgi:hypothetical protein
MGTVTFFLFVYVFGGITFVPLVLAVIFLHALLTLPAVNNESSSLIPTADHDHDSIKSATDDGLNLKSGADILAEQFTRKHESDVAAGYFAVCREYVPGGVNGSMAFSVT